ncbi:MAG: SCO family protein [Candidatus Omnitrophica bacterium]|nr:SCO family protein [Candidatus Omnitrophota bacterium]
MLWKQFSASFLVLPALLLTFLTQVSANQELPTYGQVPDFTLIQQSGKEIKLADLKGNVWIANFVFTRCQGMCPMLTGRMAGLQERFKQPHVKFISFSVDPEYDTPKVLSEYAVRYHAEEGKWFFLTGDKKVMWNFITEGFSLGVADASPEDLAAGAEPVMHSGRFVLIDQKGSIRGYYDSSEPSKVEELVRDASLLAMTD